MTKRHPLLERQLREATGKDGAFDREKFLELVEKTYRARIGEHERAGFVRDDADETRLSPIEDEQVFRDFAAAVSDRFWECDREFRFTRRWTNGDVAATFGETEFIGRHLWDIYQDIDGDTGAEKLKAALRARRPIKDLDIEVRATDAVQRFRRLNATPWYDESGTFMGYRGSARDVTEEISLKTLSEELFARFESFINSSPSAIFLKDLEGRYRLVNRQFAEWHGVSRSEAIGKTPVDIQPEDIAKPMTEHDRAVIDTRRVVDGELEIELADGRRMPVYFVKFPVFDRSGALTGVGSIITDITERKRVETALGDSEFMFRTVFEQNAVGMAIRAIDPRESRWLEVNRKLCDMLGYTRDELLQKTSVELSVPDEQYLAIAYNEKLQNGEIASYSREKRYVRKDGRIIWTNIWLSAVPDRDGKPSKIISVIEDITERKSSEAALRESEARVRAFMENSPSAILIKDRDGRYLVANRRWHDWFNPDGTDITGKTVYDFFPKDHAAAVEQADRRILKTGEMEENEILTPLADGTHRATLLQKFPVYDNDGNIVAVAGINTDLTERKAMEEQLAQAQKMEAVGKLTGGVAHDFNNLLTIIQGNAQLLAHKATGLESLTEPIVRASRRGAELTQRLLAFSRRQPLQPKALDLSALTEGMLDLLRRTLGETIEISLSAAPDLWPALADAGQLENALLNLAINSRDAMPDGGKLSITCSNQAVEFVPAAANQDAAPGDYTLITVCDTGTGMSPQVREHAFEPFFTTKEVGQGSGLGLSMVFGFVSQSYGFVELESEEGHGTIVRLYLPRALLPSAERTPPAPHPPPRGNRETILLIEDEEEVRALGIRMLESLGYRVSAAMDAAAARELIAQNGPPELILTDVVLPGGVSGPDFALETREHYPDMKIIFMSGYPAEALAEHPSLGNGDVLINKPFQFEELADHLRAALDGSP